MNIKPENIRRKIIVFGSVQGVGMRPFVYRLAHQYGLSGHVQNRHNNVEILVKGAVSDIQKFTADLFNKTPPNCYITGSQIEDRELEIEFENKRKKIQKDAFSIIDSSGADKKKRVIQFLNIQDRAICPGCLAELQSGRRKNFAFNTCVDCGPRFSILMKTPFDRINTSMNVFDLCENCQEEYSNPGDIRFHAQTISCPACGPAVTGFLYGKNTPQKYNNDAIEEAAKILRQGGVAAVKSTGAFHLVCNASNEAAVETIRKIKNRPFKPFALMYPGIEKIKSCYYVDSKSEELLLSPQRPIVLLNPFVNPFVNSSRSSGKGDRQNNLNINLYTYPEQTTAAASVNKGVRKTGVFLPDSALYHLLFRQIDFALVATSFNAAGRPLITEDHEIMKNHFNGIDYVLGHNRKIINAVDDSVICVASENAYIDGACESAGPLTQAKYKTKKQNINANNIESYTIPMRLGKGFAPLLMKIEHAKCNTLAVGAQAKVAPALCAKTGHAIIDPHIGDLFDADYRNLFDTKCRALIDRHNVNIERIVCDANASYFSHSWAKKFAEENRIPLLKVYHHHAHAMSLMAEHNIPAGERLFCAAFDGAGLGPDGAIWGGEFLNAGYDGFERITRFRPFLMLGGESMALNPWKSALSVLFTLDNEEALNMPFVRDNILNNSINTTKPLNAVSDAKKTSDYGGDDLHNLHDLYTAWKLKINMPSTSSAGRLFDAASHILGICSYNSYEGEASIRLEDAADYRDKHYTELSAAQGQIDWSPLFERLIYYRKINDAAGGASFFINSMAHAVVRQAQTSGHIGLTGGVFQNSKLLLKIIDLAGSVKGKKIKLYLHTKIPCNDGGISFGQLAYNGNTS